MAGDYFISRFSKYARAHEQVYENILNTYNVKLILFPLLAGLP